MCSHIHWDSSSAERKFQTYDVSYLQEMCALYIQSKNDLYDRSGNSRPTQALLPLLSSPGCGSPRLSLSKLSNEKLEKLGGLGSGAGVTAFQELRGRQHRRTNLVEQVSGNVEAYQRSSPIIISITTVVNPLPKIRPGIRTYHQRKSSVKGATSLANAPLALCSVLKGFRR